MKQTVINPEPFYAAFANLTLACACLRLAIVRMALGVKLLAMSAGQNSAISRLAFQAGKSLLRLTFAVIRCEATKNPLSHVPTSEKSRK